MSDLSFDWKFYTSIYEDLSNLKDHTSAYEHYLQKGIFEKRICNQNKIPNNFDWQFYISFYPDLTIIDSEKNAKKHFITHGLSENRICSIEQISKIIDLKQFDWKFYIKFYKDLSGLQNKFHALHHYFHHGRHEGRIGCKVNGVVNDCFFDSDVYENTKIAGIADITEQNNVVGDFVVEKEKILDEKLVLDENQILCCSKEQLLNNDNNDKKETVIEKKDNWESFVNKKKAESLLVKNLELKKLNYKNIEYKSHPEFDVQFYYNMRTGSDNFDDNLSFEMSNSDIDSYYKEWQEHIRMKKHDKMSLQSVRKNLELNDSMPFITFIIPTVGRVSLMQAVNSLLALKSDDWKAIILFDGVKNTYPINDHRIDIYELEKKGIYNHAGEVRNVGLDMIKNKTKWIAFLDDDDTVCPYYIHRLKQESIKNPTMELCLFRMIYPNMFVLPSNDTEYIKRDYVGISFAYKGYIPTRFSSSSREDYYFLKKVEYEGYRIVFSLFTTYFIRQNPFLIDNNDFQRVFINF